LSRKQAIYTASLTVAYVSFFLESLLKTLCISAVADIKKQVIPRVLT